MREFFPLPHVLETIFILLKEHYNLVFTLVKPQVEIYFYRQGLKERLYASFSFLCKSISISLTRWFMDLLLNEKRQKISHDKFLIFKNINQPFDRPVPYQMCTLKKYLNLFFYLSQEISRDQPSEYLCVQGAEKPWSEEVSIYRVTDNQGNFKVNIFTMPRGPGCFAPIFDFNI